MDDSYGFDISFAGMEADLMKSHATMVDGSFSDWVKMLEEKGARFPRLSLYSSITLRNLTRGEHGFAEDFDEYFDMYFEESLFAAGLLYVELQSSRNDISPVEVSDLMRLLALHIGRLQARTYCIKALKIDEDARRKKRIAMKQTEQFEKDLALAIFHFIEENYSGSKLSVEKLGGELAGDRSFVSLLEMKEKEAKDIKPRPSIPSLSEMARWLRARRDPLWIDKIRPRVCR